MQRDTDIKNTASAGVIRRRGRLSALPFMLIGGVLFLFVLSACQVAVAEDGTINISPESTVAKPGTNGTSGQNTTGNGATDSTAVSGNFAGLFNQAGEVDPATGSSIDPDQLYEWNGVIEWIDSRASNGGHFAIDRGCDNWVVIPQSDEVYAKLKELPGEKATVWGTVSFNQNTLGRRVINASSAFAPGDIRPLIALPEVPCNDTPVPGHRIVVNHSEITLHGDLVWRGGRLWIVTPRGAVRLELPQMIFDRLPHLALPSTGEHSALTVSLGEYGVVGMWNLANTGLVIKVRDVEEWPHRTFVRDRCGDGIHHFAVGDEQLAAHGTLIINDGQWLLRTKSGVIFVHHNSAGHDGVPFPGLDPATGATGALAPDVLRTHEVVVIGEWKTDGNELHMEGDKFVRVKTVCDPPKPPHQPILPGEIAALGTLVFENGRPFLDTPSGRIVLLTRNDMAGAEPQPADPSFFEDVAPEALDAAGDSIVGEDGTVHTDPNHPDIVHPVRHILVVGKWLLYREHLAIVVRYALPWPYPYPQPVPPIFGFPTEPVLPEDAGVLKPDFGGVAPGLIPGAASGFEDDVVIIEPADRYEVRPVKVQPGSTNGVDAVSINSLSPATVK